MGRNITRQVYPRTTIAGREYYLIAEPDILGDLAEAATNLPVEAAARMIEYYREYLAQAVKYESDYCDIPIVLQKTETGDNWCIEATRFNGARVVWMRKRAKKALKAILIRVKREVKDEFANSQGQDKNSL
jgi:hypothetical protein